MCACQIILQCTRLSTPSEKCPVKFAQIYNVCIKCKVAAIVVYIVGDAVPLATEILN